MADGTVHLPGMGDVKKTYVYAGGAVFLVLAVYMYRKRQSAAAAASTASTASTTTAPVDPATGYPTGSPEDLAALQQQNTASQYANLGGNSGGGGGGGGISTPPSSSGYASNGQWAQAAETYLVSNTGGDPATIAAALGKYVTGQVVTEAQQSVVEQAIAFAGYPPIADADGYPPSIRQAPAAPKPPAVPASKVPVGLHQVSATKTGVTVSWNGQPNTAYRIYVNGHKSAPLFGTEWTINSATAGMPIKANSAYAVQVSAVNAAGSETARSAQVNVHTAK